MQVGKHKEGSTWHLDLEVDRGKHIFLSELAEGRRQHVRKLPRPAMMQRTPPYAACYDSNERPPAPMHAMHARMMHTLKALASRFLRAPTGRIGGATTWTAIGGACSFTRWTANPSVSGYKLTILSMVPPHWHADVQYNNNNNRSLGRPS